MTPLNRRQFLGTAALGAVALSQSRVRAADGAAVGRTLKLGLIGCGWYGMVDVKAAFKAGGVDV
ncbi:MAG: twin-arginine translocation signal domain-containing protein, partial [Verrucomicrobiota bacterium]